MNKEIRRTNINTSIYELVYTIATLRREKLSVEVLGQFVSGYASAVAIFVHQNCLTFF